MGDYIIEQSQAERFMNLLNERISFWLNELESDKDRLWDLRLEKLRPSATHPSQETPATLLFEDRVRRGATNWVHLATAAAKYCKTTSYEAILAAIYRILKKQNVSRRTRACLAAALTTPSRKIEAHDLLWPRGPRERTTRESTTKE